MKVLSAELVSPDKRARILGGVYIEFETTENVKKDDYFKLYVNPFTYEFQAERIKASGDKLIVSAREVGYWRVKIDTERVDLRTLIGCLVIPVTDELEKSRIREKTCLT